ncbi:MAG TPA: glutamate-1-semialdehyde 2,1-aminomutase [Gaiellaceae bacterium]
MAVVGSSLFRRAQNVIPGGVNSPVRAMRAVGLDEPLFVARGEGPWIEGEAGRRYVDWVMSWGALVLGHAEPSVVDAVREAASRGTTFGAPTENEVRLAEEVVEAVPSIERLRLVSSGTEAAMSAIRLARGFTGRDRIVKFAGCYHGHADALLASAGSGLATLALPSTPGVPAAATADTLVCPYNDLGALREAFEAHGETIACVLVEPVAANMGVVPPEPGFLEGIRRLCDEAGALVVFDEVITGFRVARGGAQELYGVTPDLTVLGKIVGGGLPLAAFGGAAEVMDELAPAGPVYQAGTLSGNPLATAAALAVLERLRQGAVYRRLEETAAALERGLAEAGEGRAHVQRVGSLLTLFFRRGEVRDFDDASACDTDRYGEWFRHLLDRGVYVAPSQFEAMFVSTAHGAEEVDRTVAATAEVFAGPS